MLPQKPILNLKCLRLLPAIRRIFMVQGKASYRQFINGAWEPVFGSSIVLQLTFEECEPAFGLTEDEAKAVVKQLRWEAHQRLQ